MASTTPLATLLENLNIGVVSANSNGNSNDSSSSHLHAAPKLALSDQLHLLSAHTDTLEKSVQASVSSQEGKNTIKSQGQRSIDIQKRVIEVQRRVQSLEDHDEGKDIGGGAVLEYLAQYIGAQKRLQKERRLHHVIVLVKDAVLAIERLESRLQKGQLDAVGLSQSIDEANYKASLLGIRGAESTRKGKVYEEDFQWIARTSGTPPMAILELGSRLENAKERVKQLLNDCWKECVEIQAESTSIRFNVEANAKTCDINLSQLMDTLQSRSELKRLLEKLAHDVVEQILSPMLTGESSWRCDDDKSQEEWQIHKGESGRIPNETSTTLVQLLEFLHIRIFETAPAPAQTSFTISKIIVPKLVPMLLKHLKASLPSRLEKPIASHTIPRLEDISKAARGVHDALLKSDFLQRDLKDEADELFDWSRNTRKHYMKGLGTQLRTRARDLLLREAGGGWQGVTVDFELEEELPVVVQEAILPIETKANNFEPEHDEKADEAWSHWDTESAQPLQSQQPARNSSLSRQTRQKKSALGGRRVVKPADELGSGPLPESADEVSWGFDDDLSLNEHEVASGSTTEAAKKAPYDALMEALDQDEDVDEDAWGLSEEEKVEIAAKRASMRGGDMAAAFQAFQASQDKERSNLQQIQDTEEVDDDDDDDAWGLSAQEAAHEVEAGKSSGSGEKLSDTTTDPWEEISATQSNTAAPVNTLTTSAPVAGAEILPTSIGRAQSPIQRGVSENAGSSTWPLAQQTPLRPDSTASQNAVSSNEVAVLPSPLALKRPIEKCVISKRSVSLIEVIQAVLDDVEAILEEKMSEVLKTSYLVNALNDILDMHRGLLPVGHADTLANVPSLAMQFANDCLYIGKELKGMRKRWDVIQSQLPSEEKLDFDMQAELTISLGKRSFDGQLLLQHKMLLDCLQDAEGFTRTYEESRFNACQRSIKQVELILKQLQSAWRPVLTKTSYLAAMGRLVEGLLKRLMLDIESIEDISEVESEKLASLIKTMGELEYLFRDEGQSAEDSVVTLFVPSWFKVSYLSEILTGSLVDIEFLYFEAGALVDYSKAEVVSLVRSLFADTPKRARVIERIQSS